MLENLQQIEDRYEEINERLSEPGIMSRQDEYKKLMKESAELFEIVEKFKEYKKLLSDIDTAKEMLAEVKNDDDMIAILEDEIKENREKTEKIEEDIKILIIPKDPNDDRNVIMEIRGGAGGEEAALFAGVLFRAYVRYAERKRWKAEVMDGNPTELGGFKEVVFSIEGKGAYSRLKFESGVHRVQRVPETEASGRIHTSTITVSVMPEMEEVDVEINQNDLKIDIYRSGGAGGQHVNRTDSAIRITHIPSGIVVTCQDERSQLKNKERAMKILRSKLYEQELEKVTSEHAQARKSQVGTGDRSERIRTYNYPQGRVTDHRIGLSLYRIEDIVDGDLDEFIDALTTAANTQKLGSGSMGED